MQNPELNWRRRGPWRAAMWLLALLALGMVAEVRAIFPLVPNDLFVNAWFLPGDTGTTNGYNNYATIEPLEPRHYYFQADNSVWFRWRPSVNGYATFDTFGSTFDTILAAYTSYGLLAPTVGTLGMVAPPSDDYPLPNSPSNFTSQVTFYAMTNYEYFLAIVGYPGRSYYYYPIYSTNFMMISNLDSGNYVLNWNLTTTFTNVLISTNQIEFASATYTVAEDTPGFATINVLYNGGAVQPVTVSYSTRDGSAVAGIDYLPAGGTLTFNVGETNKSFLVQVIDNAMANSNKTVLLSLSNPGGGASLGPISSATLTIIDNETVPFQSTAGEFNFAKTVYRITENEGLHTSYSPLNDRPGFAQEDSYYREVCGAIVTVTRTKGSTGRVLVDWYTTTKFVLTNTFYSPYGYYLPFYIPYVGLGYYYGIETIAQEYLHYFPTNGTLVFDDFQTSTNFVVPIEPSLYFYGYYLGYGLFTNNAISLIGLRLANPRPAPEEDPALIKPTLGPTNQAAVAIVGVNGFSVIGTTTGGAYTVASGFAFERLTYRMNEYGHLYTEGISNSLAYGASTNNNVIRIDVLLPSGGPGTVRVEVWGGAVGYELMAGSDYADGVDRVFPDTRHTDGMPAARNPADYQSYFLNLTFGGNQTAATFYVTNNNDGLAEFNEDIDITLIPLANNPPVNYLAYRANITILYDDPPAGMADRDWNPANDPRVTPPFNAAPGANGEVAVVLVQPDGRQIIAGAFSDYNAVVRNHIARINLDGSNDASYDIGTGANDYIAAAALYPADTPNTNNVGKLIIAGNFTSFSGASVPRIARLNPDGKLDTTFRPGDGADGVIRSVAIQSDGKVLIAGEFMRYNGEVRTRIARLNDDGSLDLLFDPGLGADGTIWAMDVRDTPKTIFVPRSATGTEYEDVNAIDTGSDQGTITINYDFLSVPDTIRVYYQGVRLVDLFTNGVGQLVIPYGPGTNTVVTIVMNEGIGILGTVWSYTVGITPVVRERTICVGGDFTTFNGVTRAGVARLRDNGSLDDTFDPKAGADNTIYALAVQADGKVLIGGAFTDIDFRSRNGIARLLRDGSLDTGYDPGTGFNDTVMAISLQRDNKALVGGYFTSFNQTRRVGLARLFQNGLLDTSFMDTAYNQFAGLIQPFSFSPQNKVNSIFPYSVTNIDLSTQTITNAGTNLVITITNLSEVQYVMIGGSFTQLGGNQSFFVNDTNNYISTRQDKVVRYNVARLVGGATPGPGNLTFSFDQNISEHAGQSTIKMERLDGRLGTLQGLSFTSNRVAQAGVDYGATSVTNTFAEYSYWRIWGPRSVGWVEPIYFNVPILDNQIVQSDRIFDLMLMNPEASITLGGEWIPLGGARGVPTRQVTIIDDDVNRGVISFDSPAYTVNENAGDAVITLLRTNGSVGMVSIDVYTRDDNARAGPNLPGFDYQGIYQTITFGDGETNKLVRIRIWNDNEVEPDERIGLVLTNATGGATLPGGLPTSTETATLTIIDDDFLPGRFNFSSAAYQTNEGAGFARITVTRTGGNMGSVSVQVAATDSTATSGLDFVALTNILKWNSGESAPKTFSVPLKVDLLVEGPETVNLRLFNASTNGAIGSRSTAVLTILDDNGYGTFNFSQPSFDANEDGGAISISVVRSDKTNGTVQVHYQVQDGSARNGVNYNGLDGTLTFVDGEISKSFVIGLIHNPKPEGIKTVNLRLDQLTPVGAILGPVSGATLNILDKESLNVPAGSLDDEFSGAIGTNNAIYALARQVDGNLLVGGDFTTYNHVSRIRLARLQPNGALDATFNAGGGPNRSVRAIALQQDGRVLVAGFFTSINAVPRGHIARLTADGTLDRSFDPGGGADKQIYAMAVLPDGRIVIGGAFATYNSVSRAGIAMVNTNGTLNLDFDPYPGVNGTVYAIALQPDGRLIIGGDFDTVANEPRSRIARLNPDGSLDTSFDPGAGANDTVRALVVQRDGKIVVGGSFTSFAGEPRFSLARLNGDGSLDTNYLANAQGADNTVYALAVQADGKMIVGGDFLGFNGVNRHRLTRLDEDGRTDPTINFGDGANGFIAALLIQPDRKIVLAGGFTAFDGQPKAYVARVHGGSIAGSGALEFASAQYVVDEFSPYAAVTVIRRGGLTNQVSVWAATTDMTAIAGADYIGQTNYLVFPEGEVEQTFLVPILDDSEVEDPESVWLELRDFQGAEVGLQPWAELVILSDDSRLSFLTKNFYVNEAAPSGFATITVLRTGATNSAVSVDYATLDGTARAGLDYGTASGSLLFNPGQTLKQFFVNITNDDLVEGNETVLLVLTNSSANGQMGDYPTATLTIIDDELAAGEFNFSSPVYTVNEYETNILITVIRTNGTSGYVSVNYRTSDGSAQGGLDYKAVSGGLSFADGETVKTFSVPIYQDFLDETNETVILTLANPGGGAVLGGTATATLTIQNTRLINGNLNFAATNYTVTEGSLAVRITVTRAFGSQGPIAVNYRTVDGTARAGADYVPATNVLFWPAGDASPKTFTVSIVNDNIVEDTETFGVLLFNPTGGATLGGVPSTTVTILDDDTGPGFLGFSTTDYYVSEGGTNAYITVQRTFGRTGLNTIQYRTGAGGTALAGLDYVPTNGTLTFLDGETLKSFAVRIIERPGVEDLKTIPLELYGPMNPAYTNGQTIAATLTIVENEPQAGSVDLSYNAQANNQVYTLALQTNVSKLYVGGDFTLLNGLARLRVGRVNLNGSLDTTFDATTNFFKSVRVLALQNASNLLVGGVFTNVAGAGKSYLVRLKPDGMLDTNFLADVDNSVQALALQTDGKILVGGAFTRVNGQTRNFLVRLNADGSLDVNFKTNAAADAVVRAIACQNDGAILVAGDFDFINGVERHHIARLLPTGELDPAFDPGTGPNDTVQCLALQPDGAALLGGRFTTVNGTPRGRVARLTALGSLDGSFDPGDGANEWIGALAVEPNGKIYVAGGFTIFDKAPLRRLARLNANGSLDPTINFGAGANNFINALVLQPDRKIIIGGGFTEFDGVPRPYLARLNSSENAGMGSFVFGPTNFGAIESQPNATITVRRLAGTAGTVAVDYFTFDGTAKAGINYSPASGTLVFGPSETIQTFDIPLVDDQLANADRTIGLALTNVVGGATLGLNRTATLTITNDDAVVGFAINSYSVSENAGNALIAVQRLGSSVGAVTVDYFTRDGSATNGVDYGAVSGTLFFADGQTLATFGVPIFDDALPEPNKVAWLFLTNATGTATLGLAAASLTIIDDDFSAGMLSFAQPVFYTTEQTNYAAVFVQRSAGGSGSASIQYSTSDGPNARAGFDYLPVTGQLGFSDNETLKAFLVPIINDEVVGGPKTINLTLSNPLGGQLGISAATLVVLPDEAILDFAATNFVVAENGLNALITVTRTGGGTNVVSVDYYTRAGTATNGFNYSNTTGRLTFGPNDASLTFTVPLINNNVGQDNMFFFVVLTNAQGEAVLGPSSTATVTIIDDDVSFVFEPVNYIVPESISNALVIIVRQGRTNGVASVDFATGDGTALAGQDYVFTAIRLTFADGQLSQTVSIPIIDDNEAEGNEFLFLYLNNPSTGATLAAGSTGTLTIVDDEDALHFEVADYFVDEGATNVTLYVVRAGLPSGPLTVAYATSNATATAGLDYTPANGLLVFSAYEFMKAITVPILEDTLAEGDETFTVRLFNISPGASLISPSNATVTIVDNDVAFHFDAGAYSVPEDGTNALVRVVRQGGTSNQVSVTLVTSDGTATAGQDYLAVSNVVVFPPGMVTQTVLVPILDDLLIEGDETVRLRLLNPQPPGAMLGSPAQATLTIADNDACVVVPSGVSIESESPAAKVNGRIDPGETISAWFGLRNIGNVDGLNVIATLLNTNGVTPLNIPTAAYPVLTAGGITRSMRFTFQANGPNGARIAATFQVSNGTNSLGLVSFPFILGEATAQFTNAASIIINDRSPATPYPSTVIISGVSGLVSRVTVTLRNVSHSYPQDIDILLVGPTGEKVLLMANACSNAIANVNLTFDSQATNAVPNTGNVASGTYMPTVYGLAEFDPPAPAGPYSKTLDVFKGKNPNGIWSLYVMDDDFQDAGNIAGGWGLNISTIDSGTASADLALTMDRQPASAMPDRVLTYYLSVTNGGPNVATNVVVTDSLPAKVTFLGCTSGQPTTVTNQVVTSSVGNLSAGAGVTIVLQVRIAANLAPGEVLFNSATATCGTVELNLANNTAALKTFGAAKPALAISFKGSALLLAWPSGDVPCHLEACDGLELGNWTRVSSPAPVVSGSLTTVTISAPTAPRRFYRLVEGQ